MGTAAPEGIAVRGIWALALNVSLWSAPNYPLNAEEDAALLAIMGAPGEARFQPLFEQSMDRLRQVAERGQTGLTVIGLENDEQETDKSRLRRTLDSFTGPSPAPLWLIYVGHGTFDGEIASLNLRGPDVSQDELAEWIAPIERPMVIALGGSSSAPFLPVLSGENRVVMTATRDGFESSYARFGENFTKALLGLDGDLDRDGQVSALEAFLKASSDTRTFYEQERRLASEHALIDDNGDGLGSPGDWFRGVRPVQRPKDAEKLDGYRAAQLTLIPSEEEMALTPDQRARRDALELELIELRDRQSDLDRDVYEVQLEELILQLAEIYVPGFEAPGSETPGGSNQLRIQLNREPPSPTNELDGTQP